MSDLIRKLVGAGDEVLADLRQVVVVISTATPDRAGDIVVQEGIDHRAFMALGGTVLWQHDAAQPIARCIQIGLVSGKTVARVQFPPAGVSSKADEILGLIQAQVVNSASIGFAPRKSKPIDPKDRSAGQRFESVEIMEFSFVSVPCNTEAAIVARTMTDSGLDLKPRQGTLKVGASLNLPISADDEIGPDAAAREILAHCGFGGDRPDANFARKAFLAYDPGAPQDQASYALVFAKMTDGRLTVTRSSLSAARRELERAGLPPEIEAKAKAVLQHYEAKMPKSDDDPFVVKDLWGCALLAETLASLGWQRARSLDEAAYEGDDSKLPAMLGEILTQVGAALVAMTQEEVAELLSGHGLELPLDEIDAVELEARPLRKNWLAARLKAGRVLSAENVEHKQAILKCMKAMSAACLKAADLHDDVHAELEAMQGHVEEATKRAKLLGAKKPKPASEPDDDDGEGDENSDDADDDDPESDRELAAAAQRKREIDSLALA